MEDYKDRVLEEANKLGNKIGKLADFIRSDGFDKLNNIDKDLLIDQRSYMLKYFDILNSRIERF